ncbi:MAG: hypothetical protein ACT4PG_02775 [Panacagrimonas sp.]
MANLAQYTKNVRHTVATLSAANTNLDGSGTMVDLVLAPAMVDVVNPGGSRIERLVAKATGATTAGFIRVFISDSVAANTSGNTHLWLEVPVPEVALSTAAVSWSEVLSAVDAPHLFPLILGPGQVLRVATQKAEGFRVHAELGDY